MKNGQRSDPGWKDAWSTWCTTSGDGKKDPASHPIDRLHQALFELGEPPSQPSPSAVEQTPEQVALMTQVKELQKASPGFKDGWLEYVKAHDPFNRRDPARHEVAFLQGALATLAGGQAQLQTKLSAAASLFSGGGAPVGSPEQKVLVTKVKDLQRTDAAFRDGWCQLVAAHGGGTRDPARHDAGFLQTALNVLWTQ